MPIAIVLARRALNLARRARRCVRRTLETTSSIQMPDRGIAAHRGASATHPENTLAAFKQALELGVQQIELDVRQTWDRKLIVMHDKTLDRTTDGEGIVKEHWFRQIKRLDAGSWKHSRFEGEPVPTLADALRKIPRDVWINLHIKGPPRTAGSAARLVHVLDRTHQVILAAKAEGVRAARNWVPNIKICCMDRGGSLEDYIQRAVALEADFIQPLRKDGMPSAESVESAHRAGLKLNFCTAIDEGEVARLFELGVDFPMLDDPSLASDLAGQARPIGDTAGPRTTSDDFRDGAH